MDRHELRGCRGGQRPSTHYELLGIAPGERDPAAIEEAAVRRSGQVRAYQLTREPECTRLLDAIARAVDTLLDPARRAEYDRGLGIPPAPLAPASRGLARALFPGGVRARRRCDVELVFRAGAGRLSPFAVRIRPAAITEVPGILVELLGRGGFGEVWKAQHVIRSFPGKRRTG